MNMWPGAPGRLRTPPQSGIPITAMPAGLRERVCVYVGQGAEVFKSR